MSQQPQTQKWQMIAVLALPPLFWAGNFIVARAARDLVPPLSLVWGRWLIALIVLAPFAARHVRRDWQSYWRYPWLVLGTSVTSVIAFNTLIYWGLHYTQATNGMLLNSTIPVLVMLIGALVFRQRLRLWQAAGLALSLVGVAVVIMGGDPQRLAQLAFNKGDLLIFAAMVAWAFYTLWLTRLPAEISRVGLLAVQIVIGLVVLTPFWLWDLSLGHQPVLVPQAAFAVLFVGIVPSLGAFLLYMQAVKLAGSGRASQAIHLIPLYGVILSTLFLGESLHLYHLAGFALILGGILLAARSPKPAQPMVQGAK
ncbi:MULTISPECIES: DMT family transporter [Thioclava]|uniref:DMT family transporter n=1 Tax=Thioclava litoralis TaxID=3076557 RepID=A0ABZ1DY67_9RHOB|nr:DMT family transporter [Thioclava sp. FTW29]